MNSSIITKLIKIANKLDSTGKHYEANILTKIAQDMSDKEVIKDDTYDFIDEIEGNFLKLISFYDNNLNSMVYQIVSRVDGDVKKYRPNPVLEFARRDFNRLKMDLLKSGVKFETFELPLTKEEKRSIERMYQRGERQRGDWEPGRNPYRSGPGGRWR